MVIILMGVSGSGKTTVGRILAEMLHCPFHDADQFHPSSNVAKMQKGIPLTEADRAPWLDALAEAIEGWVRSRQTTVLACSALTRAARRKLQVDEGRVRFVHLQGDFDLIRRRLDDRQGHYMPPTLLQSQFQTLEEPDADEALTVSIDADPPKIAEKVRQAVGL